MTEFAEMGTKIVIIITIIIFKNREKNKNII